MDATETRALLAAEDAGWAEFHGLIDRLTAEQVLQPGYFDEGWTAKDVLGHVGAWLAEAGMVLERICVGTYRLDEIDVDATNRESLEAMRDVPIELVKAQSWSARNRMLAAWKTLPESSDDAEFWISKAGPEHYDEHLPRLREWVEQLTGT